VVQGVGMAAALIMCAAMGIVLLRRRVFLRAPGWGRAVGIGLLGVLISLPIVGVQYQAATIVLQAIRPDLPPPTHETLVALTRTEWGDWGRLQLFVHAVVVAPLLEELFFRGLLLPALWTAGQHAWIAVILTGTLFGFMHAAQPQAVLPLATLGILLGAIYVRYRSLLACVVLHVMFNLRTMVITMLAPELLERSF
jgi:membrane protease YdiL (CAAX protease family)